MEWDTVEKKTNRRRDLERKCIPLYLSSPEVAGVEGSSGLTIDPRTQKWASSVGDKNGPDTETRTSKRQNHASVVDRKICLTSVTRRSGRDALVAARNNERSCDARLVVMRDSIMSRGSTSTKSTTTGCEFLMTKTATYPQANTSPCVLNYAAAELRTC
jgi:hypothetical protein